MGSEYVRESGILLPVTALPGPYGIGCFSDEARRWVDALAAAGQSYWQILPLGPTGYGDSPYQSFSTFAGNPYFIDPAALEREGLLTGAELSEADRGQDPARIDYGRLYRERYGLLRTAFGRACPAAAGGADTADGMAALSAAERGFERFRREQGGWLEDYALFMALKARFGGEPWTAWPERYRLRDPDALASARRELAGELAFHCWMQYRFFTQWEALRTYAHGKGVRIIGDIPIYVAMDSADTWANPGLFRLDERNCPVAVAGVPPDGFSPTGQLWGNPLYRWDFHRETGYSWWMERLGQAFRLYDVLRIDHFRGFDEYFAVPWGEDTAVNGHWEKGPGLGFFRAMEAKLGRREVIAEDLGYVTDTVRQLVRDTGFPGMKGLEFAFDSRDTGAASDYLPHNYPANAVVYTGTHDNETAAGWLAGLPAEERAQVRAYLCDAYAPDRALYRPFVAQAMRSPARLCVVPLQDWLGLDNGARMNRPSTVGENWRWRVTREQLTEALWEDVRGMTRRYGRAAAVK